MYSVQRPENQNILNYNLALFLYNVVKLAAYSKERTAQKSNTVEVGGSPLCILCKDRT